MRGCAQLHKGIALRFHMRAQPLNVLPLLAKQIALVGRHDLRPLGQGWAVLAELGTDGVKILQRVAPLAAGHVHQMHQQTAAIDMAQEIMTQARALRGTLDDAGDIRHDEGRALVHIHHAQIRKKRGEMVICDLRMRLADNAQKR